MKESLVSHIERCGSSNLSNNRNAVHCSDCCSDVKSQDRCLKSFARWLRVFTAWLACLYWKSPKRLTPEEDAELWRKAKEFSLFYLFLLEFFETFRKFTSESKVIFWVFLSFTKAALQSTFQHCNAALPPSLHHLHLFLHLSLFFHHLRKSNLAFVKKRSEGLQSYEFYQFF